MVLTTKGRYAINAILEIAQSKDNKPITLSRISQSQNISLPYLEQIFSNLKKADLVKSVKGPGGGYILNRKREITANDIILATGEKMKMTSCANENNCIKHGTLNNKCKTHHIWKGLERTISDYFDSISISNFANSDGDKND